MARHLLLVVLMYSFCEMEAQALQPPALTVDKLMITETDSVTLNCQTPPSVSVSECYFSIVSGQLPKGFSCLKTLTGTELLKISHQSSPAEVKVTCFYLQMSQSPDSDTSSIIIRTSVPPQLRVNPSVISETDSVTLECQTPPSVSVSQCHFYTSSGINVRDSSCRLSLTGTELLKKSHQGSYADVKVTCFYTVKFGESDSPSPHSDTASITINNIVEREFSMTTPTFTLTTGLTIHTTTPVTPVKQTAGGSVGIPDSFTSTFPTSETSTTPNNPEPADAITGSSISTASTKGSLLSASPQKTTSELWIWKFAAVAAGGGVTVGCIVLVAAIRCNQRRAGSEKVKQQKPQDESHEMYHLYSTIPEEPAAPDLSQMTYSTVQAH